MENMKLTDLFLAELEREAASTRRTLERVPDGRADWKPHEKSMSLGRLATLVASMPSWIVMMVNQDELDINPPGGAPYKEPELQTSRGRPRRSCREGARSAGEHHGRAPDDAMEVCRRRPCG
jgi:hypothetical protein